MVNAVGDFEVKRRFKGSSFYIFAVLDIRSSFCSKIVQYLGSTVVKELRGTESTKKSIQKLKKTCREPRVTPDITLAISFRGVRFLNTVTNVRYF